MEGTLGGTLPRLRPMSILHWPRLLGAALQITLPLQIHLQLPLDIETQATTVITSLEARLPAIQCRSQDQSTTINNDDWGQNALNQGLNWIWQNLLSGQCNLPKESTEPVNIISYRRIVMAIKSNFPRMNYWVVYIYQESATVPRNGCVFYEPSYQILRGFKNRRLNIEVSKLCPRCLLRINQLWSIEIAYEVRNL